MPPVVLPFESPPSSQEMESLFDRCHHRRFVHPDPLEFVWRFKTPDDQEVVGLLAASLAFGRVRSILNSVDKVLLELGPHPATKVDSGTHKDEQERLGTFVHRYARGEHLVDLLEGIRRTRQTFGSLKGAFAAHLTPDAQTTLPALQGFVQELSSHSSLARNPLIPNPSGPSACKRLHLFLRWMIRSDDVDPGPWKGISSSLLVVPLDVHMHRMARKYGWTHRSSAGRNAALDVTAALRVFDLQDPVRFDFALTRPGIWGRSPKVP